MSLGLHRAWKRFAVEISGVRRGQRVLDLASGTGDLAKRFVNVVGDVGVVVLADINTGMLRNARSRLVDKGFLGNVAYVQVDAEALPFPDDWFDCICIAFGLRNVSQKGRALRSMYRALRPSGKVLILEFSTPVIGSLRPLYDAYCFKVLPWLGERVVGDRNSYRYLAESIRMHPDQVSLTRMMQEAGFEKCSYFNLTGGVCALHRGYKL
jgi:demethylmenaquinone methyltransferase/2-methoxy-6-polyprenyl-1,4-benzoquinol methylase